MANNGFKCIYLVCIDYKNDINHVIGRNPSLKKARKIASDARTKWPDKDIYISVEKILENPMITDSVRDMGLEYSYPKSVAVATSAASVSRNPGAICICGKQTGECVGELDCRCNALAKCKNIDLTKIILKNLIQNLII